MAFSFKIGMGVPFIWQHGVGGMPPVNLVAPAITGSVTQNSVLTLDVGLWTGAVTFEIQVTQTTPTATPLARQTVTGTTTGTLTTDVGGSLTLNVWATSASGAVTLASSAVFGPITSPVPTLVFVGSKSVAISAATGNWPQTVSLASGLTGGVGSAVAAGDLVIVGVGMAAGTQRAPSITTSGYSTTAALYAAAQTNRANLIVGWKVMSGTPDANVIATFASFASDCGANIGIHVWRGVNGTTPMDVTPVTATGSGSAAPNPPAITPVTSGAEIVVVGFSASTLAQTLSSSLDYPLSVNFNASNHDAAMHIAGITWGTGAVDPAVIPASATAATNTWAAVTLALQPAP